jgi:two-component sensor histidine kinase
MAVHELTTNAGKYGALTNDEGCVDIVWNIFGQGNEKDKFFISWAERNGPLVTPPVRRGFGSTVISKLARASLDARIDLDYAPSGFLWRLECAAQRVVAAGPSPKAATKRA